VFSRHPARLLILFGAALLTLLIAGCGGSTTADSPTPDGPVTLRLGYFANITHAPALIGVKDGTFAQELGDNVNLEVKTFNAGPSAIEALFAGEIDITYVGPNPAIHGFVQSNGEALRIIAGATSGGASLIIRPDRGIETPQDFAGKRIASPQLGNTQDVALRAWLLEHGLRARERGGNVDILPTENATIHTLFQKGDIDGAWVPEPWATRLIQQAGGKRFLDERTLWPDGRFVTTHIIVRTAFLERHPEVVERFLRGHVKVVLAMQADPERAKTVTNEAFKELTTVALPEAVIDAAWENMEFTFDPIASSLREGAADAQKLGFFGAKNPDLSGIYDLTLLNRVLADLNLPPVKE
jgi:NitT/TauT family transport system substrate-binding protein